MSRRQLYIGLFVGLVVVAGVAVGFGVKDKSSDEAANASESEPNSAAPGSSNPDRPLLAPSRLTGSGGEVPTMAGTVTGRVVDAVTGEPVPFVDIVFRKGNEEAAASSDESGAYETSLSAGSYEIRAIGEGVIARALPALRIGTAPEVRLDIAVTRLATLRGKVVDPKGRALADVEILLRSDTKAGAAFPHRGEIGVTSSDSDGSFELQVPPGAADLEAKLGATAVFSTMPKVESGATLDDLRIVMDRRGMIRGMVTRPGGGLAAGAEVMMSYRRAGTSAFETRHFTTDSAGAFVARDLAPVTYVLEATHKEHAPSGPQRVPLTADLLELAVQLELSTPASISGRVVDSEGRPVGNAQVAQVWINSKQRFAKLETYADGKFEFNGLGPGPHMIRASKEGYAEVRKNGVKAPSKDLELVLVASGGIEGTITDSNGQPVTSFTLSYSSAGKAGSASNSSSRFSSEDGSFQAYPVAPGRYTVRISAKTEAGGISASKDVVVPAGGYGDATMALVARE